MRRKFSILLGVIFILFLGFWLINRFWRQAEAKVKSQDGQVNVLILGKAGKGYSAPDLTDTMIFASVSLNPPQIVLVSIPRDIWIPEIRAKVNSAYYWGGFALAKETVEKILGQPVHYAVVLDFSAFKEVVDALGGVEVNVERAFTDEKYPLAGREKDLCGGDPEYKCRYETLGFEAGKQTMDGETALKFVRSRNAPGEEGTDLAREARQQKVIAAIKTKVLSWQTLLNPRKDRALLKILQSSIETDLDRSVWAVLLKRLILAEGQIAAQIFPDGILKVAPRSQKYDYQYVFIPAAGDWSQVHEWLNQLIKEN